MVTADQIRAAQDVLKAAKAEGAHIPREAPKLTFKVATKGGLSVYGLQRFPVTLYAAQWERLLQHSEALAAFINANRSRLAVKED